MRKKVITQYTKLENLIKVYKGVNFKKILNSLSKIKSKKVSMIDGPN